jgi:hypothetical protein
MDRDQQQHRDDGQSDDQNQRGNSTENEQERFGDQVRNSPQGKKGKDRVDPQSNLPTDRPLGEVRQGDPDWNGEWNDQRLSPSSADTDLDSDIERGV